MPRTVSASEAKTRLGSLVQWIAESQDDLIIESHGQPKAVLMSFEAYQRVRALREEARREQALARLERLREQVSTRNRDLDEQGVQALAERVADEAVDRLVDDGRVAFEG